MDLRDQWAQLPVLSESPSFTFLTEANPTPTQADEVSRNRILDQTVKSLISLSAILKS